MKEFKMKINGNEYNVTITNVEENIAEVEVNGMPYKVSVDKPMRKATPVVRPTITKPNNTTPTAVSAPTVPVSKPATGGAGGSIKSPLPGVILEVAIKEGDAVKVGQKLFVLEAMKMENVINSDKEGKVIEIKVKQGDSVLEGADLVIIG
jgi:biotin carboxyl carrier protein